MLIPRNHAGLFITPYMFSSFSRYILFISEFIIICFMIYEAYQPNSHSSFHTAIVFKHAAAENLIQLCEQMIVTGWRVVLTNQAVRFITNKVAYNVNVLNDRLS